MAAPTLLSTEHERLRGDLRATLRQVEAVLGALGAPAEDRARLAEAIRGLDELFLLVVVGEFNAGKSALLNELLGARILAEGVTPTTAAITLVRHGERETEEWRGQAFLERRLPSEAVRDLAVVDTPGTNAIVREHEHLTRDFVPRSDLVLFVTSSDRPLTETERALLERIREWGKKVVVVVNKIDLLETSAAVQEVLDFVRDGLRTSLGFSPPIFTVSVRLARLAAEATDPAAKRALVDASHLEELRAFVFDTLDEEERLRLKLSNPLGIAERLAEQHSRLVDERLATLADDTRLVDNVDRQIEGYAEDLQRAFGPRLSEIENIVHELNDRGERFFEETVRIGRIFDLLNTERTRSAFEREVLRDTAERIDQVVATTVDWFVESEARLWRQVSGLIRQRQQATTGLQADPDFLVTRREVLHGVAERARRALSGFDREREAREIGQSMRDAVAQTALAEIGAVSLGAGIALLIGTAAADVTGLLVGTLAAGLGLYILPHRKRRALADFRKRTEELRQRLVQALRAQLDREIADSAERVREAIAPYTRYVRAESAQLEAQRAELTRLREDLGRLRGQVDPPGGGSG
jgi:small GTP-binding protein